MRIDIAWWDLEGSGQTVESLREHLRHEAVDSWSDVPGLLLKVWMADPWNNRWGAMMLWETDRPAEGLPPNRAAELIGRPPTHRERFDAEALVEGVHSLPSLHRLGPALIP